MTQVLFYSIQSEPIANILNDLKTIEVRKRDLPQWAKDKLTRGEKVEAYGYCTKGKPYLYAINETYIADGTDKGSWGNVLNGLVVVKFEVSGSDEIRLHKHWNSEDDYDEYLQTSKLSNDELCDKSCLSNEQLENYLTEALGYAHRLTNIQPVNMELSEFVTWDFNRWYGKDGNYTHWKPLTKAPQSFMTCWVKGE